MLLTQQEREKFALYLEQQTADSVKLLEQLKQLPSYFPQMGDILRNDAITFAYVAAKLRGGETETIEAAEAEDSEPGKTGLDTPG